MTYAKNFSISIGPQGRYHLTPLYDVLSARSWEQSDILAEVQTGDGTYVAVATITRYIEYNDATGSGMVR